MGIISIIFLISVILDKEMPVLCLVILHDYYISHSIPSHVLKSGDLCNTFQIFNLRKLNIIKTFAVSFISHPTFQLKMIYLKMLLASEKRVFQSS